MTMYYGKSLGRMAEMELAYPSESTPSIVALNQNLTYIGDPKTASEMLKILANVKSQILAQISVIASSNPAQAFILQNAVNRIALAENELRASSGDTNVSQVFSSARRDVQNLLAQAEASEPVVSEPALTLPSFGPGSVQGTGGTYDITPTILSQAIAKPSTPAQEKVLANVTTPGPNKESTWFNADEIWKFLSSAAQGFDTYQKSALQGKLMSIQASGQPLQIDKNVKAQVQGGTIPWTWIVLGAVGVGLVLVLATTPSKKADTIVVTTPPAPPQPK
jgi:hypothetical protein